MYVLEIYNQGNYLNCNNNFLGITVNQMKNYRIYEKWTITESMVHEQLQNL
jgi:hypothetical protein